VDFGTVVRASPVAGFLTSIQSFVLDCLVVNTWNGSNGNDYSYPPHFVVHEVPYYCSHTSDSYGVASPEVKVSHTV
jgi:hypothetical protein